MKKILIPLIIVIIVALAVLGLLVASRVNMVVPASNTLSQGVSRTPGHLSDVNVLRTPDTHADLLDAIQAQKKQNQDTVGWLTIPGTQVTGPVLQSFDNAYYLRRNERKETDIYGCYFADYTCSLGDRDILSPNVVIYGHSDLKDNAEGPRFSQLFKFTDQTFAERHPIIRFSTEEAVMEWQIFAVFYTDINFNYIQTHLDGPSVVALAEEAQKRSIYHYAVSVGEDDKLLTLSTCTIHYGQEEKNQRFVVMARLLSEGEEIPIKAELEINTKPKQPSFD